MISTLVNSSSNDVMNIEVSCDHNSRGKADEGGGGGRGESRSGPEEGGQDEGLDVVGVALLADADAVALAAVPRHAVVEGEVARRGAALVVLRQAERRRIGRCKSCNTFSELSDSDSTQG